MAEPGFEGIRGHADVIRQLKRAAETGRVSHAYLITGEEGCGKRTVAGTFAKKLVCQHPDPAARPCGECSACVRAAGKNHPDIIHVDHEKPNLISVDEVREKLIATADILPYESSYKIYIVPEAEKMNQQAQNALLKTIEEPPEYVVILLLTSNPDALLPTVLSRCVRLSLKPVSDRVVEEYVRDELHIPEYEAKVIAAFAQGNIGKAKKTAGDGAFSDRKDQMIALAKGIGTMKTSALYEAVKRMKDQKDSLDEMFDILLMYFRDVLYFKAAADIDGLVLTDEISAIRRSASEISYEGLTNIIDAVDRVRARLRANVDTELALELLLLAIKENCNA